MKICFGITGAISATIVPSYLLFLKAVLKQVRFEVILTQNARYFLSPGAIKHYPDVNVTSGMSTLRRQAKNHVALIDQADLLIVCPATANFLGKAAHGIADDLLTLTFLAASCEKLVMPAMNFRMYESKPVQRNVATLISDGVHILEPTRGISVQTGESGQGALADPKALLAAINRIMAGNMRRAAET